MPSRTTIQSRPGPARPTASGQTPVQEISRAEAEAKRRVEEVKRLAAKELDAFKENEERRLKEAKATLKKERDLDLAMEEKILEERRGKGMEETEREVAALKGKVKKNEPGIVAWLVEQFLSLSP